MPKRASDDVDHVPIDPKPKKKPRKPAPEPWESPHFDPLPLLQYQTHGEANLPSYVDPKDPYAISGLFFTDEVIQTLADNTNAYAESHQPPPTGHERKWKYPTTLGEMHAFLATYIYMGLHPEPSE